MVDPAARPAPDPEYLGKEDASQARQIVNNYIGMVDAKGGTTFGFGAARYRDSGRRTGRVSSRELGRLDAFYQPPPTFSEIAEKLRDNRILLLTGRSGTGRRAGAVQLLRKVAPDLSLLSLSPTVTFDELCAKKFEASGYLLADKETEPVDQARLDDITQALTDAHAYLVITLSSSAVVPELRLTTKPWPAPVPAKLLSAYLDKYATCLPKEQRRAALLQLPSEATPSQVIAIGQRLTAGQSNDDALGALSEENAARVTQWFDRQPPLDELQFVAALAFLDQTGEPTFEEALKQLVEVMTPDDGRPDTAPPDGAVRQVRHERFATESLAMVTEEADVYGTTGRTVGFKEFVSHQLLIACLHNRYGGDLWEPLSEWLRKLARRRVLERQAAIARGVAQLWKIDRAFSEKAFLIPWSKGSAAEQLTAVLTLSWLGLDNVTEDAALKFAARWAASGTAAQRRTAIVAFGGSLGVRYPSEALKWMWRSATAASNDKELELARSSVLEFCSELGSDPDTAVRLLRQILTFVESLAAGPLVRRDALKLVAEILGVRCGRVSLPTACLDQVPTSAEVLGALWARVLVNRPSRGSALDALCQCLREVERRSRTLPESAIEDLGRALLTALPSDLERRLLHQAVANGLNRINRHEGDRNSRILQALRATF